jgi:hypothetical protein
MSFNTFAYGSPSFHYQRNNNVEGDEFNALKLLATLASMRPGRGEFIPGNAGRTVGKALGSRAIGLGGSFLPSADTAGGAMALASREFLDMLVNTVSLLAISPGAGGDGAKIIVTSRNHHALWPTTVGFASYNFVPGDDPGTEFVRAIAQSLKETGLNHWGVLRSLVLVLSQYSNQIADTNTTPFVSIELDK